MVISDGDALFLYFFLPLLPIITCLSLSDVGSAYNSQTMSDFYTFRSGFRPLGPIISYARSYAIATSRAKESVTSLFDLRMQ